MTFSNRIISARGVARAGAGRAPHNPNESALRFRVSDSDAGHRVLRRGSWREPPRRPTGPTPSRSAVFGAPALLGLPGASRATAGAATRRPRGEPCRPDRRETGAVVAGHPDTHGDGVGRRHGRSWAHRVTARLRRRCAVGLPVRLTGSGAAARVTHPSGWRAPARGSGSESGRAGPAARRRAAAHDDGPTSRRRSATRCTANPTHHAASTPPRQSNGPCTYADTTSRAARSHTQRYALPSRWRRSSASMKGSRSPSSTASTLPVS